MKALQYLKSELRVIHRDVKLSNMLVNRSGEVKICDYGISGTLINSAATSVGCGCKPYMVPEKIDPESLGLAYDIRSDVWSLGISMTELATGEFPYPPCANQFEQVKMVVIDPAPRLPHNQFSTQFVELLQDAFIQKHKGSTYDMAGYVSEILDKYGEQKYKNNSHFV